VKPTAGFTFNKVTYPSHSFLYEFATRLRNRLEYAPNILRMYRNWWAWPLPKLGVDTVLELRNGLRFSVRARTTDLAVLNEAVFLNPYLASGHVELREDSVVMDVGANIGDFAIQAAARCPRGRVYAVEPMSEYSTLLETNKRLNRLSNLEIFRVALGDHQGEIKLSIAGAESGAYFNGTTKANTETARLTTLPQLMRDYGLERIDLLKMDCEGSEWDILPAARSVLPQIRQICMEIHPARGWTAERLAEWLRESGYEVWYNEPPAKSILWARRP
jgi:FkbM family methyltransferase